MGLLHGRRSTDERITNPATAVDQGQRTARSQLVQAPEQQNGYEVAAIAVGCNSPGYGKTNSDARVVPNEAIAWGSKKHCVAETREWGHLRGFGHGNQTYRIMRYPPYLEFPYC